MTAVVIACLLLGFAAGVRVGVKLTERAVARASAKATIRNQSRWRGDRSLIGALLWPGR